MKIGITESGDASLNYEWTNKTYIVDGLILITKNITDKFIHEILKVKDKTILHATCTGMGHTEMELSVPSYPIQLQQLKKLVDSGFDINHVVLRIDPIIPVLPDRLTEVTNVIRTAKILMPELKRIRISIMDFYPHVRKRFHTHFNMYPEFVKQLNSIYGNRFQVNPETMATINKTLTLLAHQYGVTFEACAEPMLTSALQTGCVSKQDLNILNLPETNTELKGQRKTCNCIAAKTELLKFKYEKTGYNHCYGCMYCYWKTEKDR